MKQKKNKGTIVGTVVFHICILLLAILMFSLKWAKDNYGNTGVTNLYSGSV